MSIEVNESPSRLMVIREAAKNSVVVFDPGDRTQIEVTGSDRARFLNSFTSNDIKRLKPGQGCETFVTNIKGKVVGHVFVFCGESSHWLDGTAGQQATIIGHLGKFLLIDDVQLIARSDERGELFVTGPLAAQLLQLDSAMPVGSHETRDSTGVTIDIRRVDLLGQPGFLMSIPRSDIANVKRGLTAIGVAEGTAEQFEILRIEAGYPSFGIDISDDQLAQEVARTKQCVSFDKGCYLGQETIARLDSLGHTNRELRRLRFDSVRVPAPGANVFDSTGATEVGTISSAECVAENTAEGTTHHVVALGMIKRVACSPGTSVRLVANGQTIEGHVLG